MTYLLNSDTQFCPNESGHCEDSEGHSVGRTWSLGTYAGCRLSSVAPLKSPVLQPITPLVCKEAKEFSGVKWWTVSRSILGVFGERVNITSSLGRNFRNRWLEVIRMNWDC